MLTYDLEAEMSERAGRQRQKKWKKKKRDNEGLVVFWAGISKISLFNEGNFGNWCVRSMFARKRGSALTKHFLSKKHEPNPFHNANSKPWISTFSFAKNNHLFKYLQPNSFFSGSASVFWFLIICFNTRGKFHMRDRRIAVLQYSWSFYVRTILHCVHCANCKLYYFCEIVFIYEKLIV